MQKIMSIRPPNEIRLKLKKMAKEKGLTVNALVINIFWEYLKKRKSSHE